MPSDPDGSGQPGCRTLGRFVVSSFVGFSVGPCFLSFFQYFVILRFPAVSCSGHIHTLLRIIS